MKKRKLLFLLPVMLFMGCLQAFAQEFEYNGLRYEVLTDQAQAVKVCSNQYQYQTLSGVIDIPKQVTYNGTRYRVTTIGDYAFSGCHDMTGVTLPEGLTTIEWNAFWDCYITSLHIPASVTSISNSITGYCTDLETITVAAGNTVYDSRSNCDAIIETATNKLIAGCKNSFILDGISEIGYGAFCGCYGLTSISIPSSVTMIQAEAFRCCSGLTGITIPSSVWYIGTAAFDNCSGLSEINIPSSVTCIETWAFSSCPGLTSVFVPASVTTIRWGAFSNCENLQSLTVDDSNPVYTSAYGANAIIEKATNRLVEGINTTTIPSFVTTIGEYAFWGCNFSSIHIPSSVTTIETWAFDDCYNLTSIDIPSSVSYIGDGAFTSCYNLSQVSLPWGLTEIRPWTFQYCTNLHTIEIPSTVTTIGEYAFYGAENLHSLKWMQPNPNDYPYGVFDGNSWGGYNWPSILIPEGSEQAFINAGWRDHASLYEEKPMVDGLFFTVLSESEATAGVVKGYAINSEGYIDQYNYEGSYDVPSHVWLNGKQYTVTEICDRAFENCYTYYDRNGVLEQKGLTAITLPSTLQRIGMHALSQTDLRSIVIPRSVTSMGGPINENRYLENPIGGNELLTSIVVEEGNPVYDSRGGCNGIIKKANNELVAGCSTTVIPSTVKSIGVGAFSLGYSELGTEENYFSINIPAGVTEIKDLAFYLNRLLTSVTIPSTVKKMGEYAFDGCIQLESVTLSDNITVIEPWTFSSCIALKTVKLPKNLTEIKERAFAYDESLASIDFPESLKTIGKAAFVKNNSLREVVLPSQIERVDSGAFARCEQLKNIVIPASLKSAKHFAFYEPNLSSVTVNATTPAEIDVTTFCNDENPINSEATLYVPSGSRASYASAAGWNVFNRIEELTTIGDGVYYLQNVETGKFLSRGNEWTTHAVVCENGLPVEITRQANGSYTFRFTHGSLNTQLLFRADEWGVYVDYNNQEDGCPYWNVSDAGNGTYYIQSLKTHEVYGQTAMPGTYLGVDWDNHVLGNMTVDGVNQLRWRLVPETAYTAPSMRQRLWTLIESAKQFGIDTNYAEEWLNYGATADDFEYAFYALRNELQNALTGEIKDTQLPLDLTSLINNPSFDINTKDGWISDQRYRGFESYHNMEYFNRDFDIYQTVYGLPNGVYSLKVKGFYRPEGDSYKVITDYLAGNDKTDAVLYANDASTPLRDMSAGMTYEPVSEWRGMAVDLDGQTVFVPNSMNDARGYFDAGLYENELIFNVSDGQATIGIRLDNCGSDGWVIFDDFRLTFLKKLDTDLAQYSDALYIDPVEVFAGGVAKLKVNMKNTVEAEGFGFDLYLPDGIEVIKDADGFPMVELSTERTTKKKTNKFSAIFRPDGAVRVLAASTNGSTISGNDGEVATVKVAVGQNMKPGYYSVEMKNVTISDKYTNTHDVPYVKSTLSVSSDKLGDANVDGKVNVGDFTTLAHHILEKPVLRFNAVTADANCDGKVNVADYTAVSHLILYGTVNRPADEEASMARVSAADLPSIGNVLYMNPVKANAGTVVTLSVKMKNSVKAEGFGFDLYLPKGMSFIKDGDGFPDASLSFQRTNDRKTDTFDSAILANGALRVFASSTGGYTIDSGDGEVARIKVNVGSKMSGKYELQLRDIVIVDAQTAESIETDVYKTTIEVGNTVGIDDIDTANEAGSQLYDLQGRKVLKAGTGARSSQKGLYIRDGKKVVVK